MGIEGELVELGDIVELHIEIGIDTAAPNIPTTTEHDTGARGEEIQSTKSAAAFSTNDRPSQNMFL